MNTDSLCEIATQQALYGQWITPSAILASAVLASILALLSIRAQRQIARRRATLDLLQERALDGDYIRAKHQFNKLRDDGAGLTPWAGNDKRSEPELDSIRTILNGHELMAIGIREKIIDEGLYRRCESSSYLKDWRKSRAFIEHIREAEQAPKLFCEFEWLAKRWGADGMPRRWWELR